MIADMIPKRVAYTQLAEECTELAHAALKLGRKADPAQSYAMGDDDRKGWLDNLIEEIANVQACIDVVLSYYEDKYSVIERIMDIKVEKINRWEDRLREGGNE